MVGRRARPWALLSMSLACNGCELLAPLADQSSPLPEPDASDDRSVDTPDTNDVSLPDVADAGDVSQEDSAIPESAPPADRREVGPPPDAGRGCLSTKPFPSTPVRDTFDGTLGNWIDPKGAFFIQNGVLRANSAAALYWSTPFGPNQEAYARFVDWDPGIYRLSVILKKQDPAVDCSNIVAYYSHYFGGAGKSLQAEYCWLSSQNGGDIIDFDLQKGQQFGVRSFADGRVELYVDGTCIYGEKFPIGDGAAPPWLSQGGYIGVETVPVRDGPVNVKPAWDDFGGGDFDPGP